MIEWFAEHVCAKQLLSELCGNLFFVLCGFDEKNLNMVRIKHVMSDCFFELSSVRLGRLFPDSHSSLHRTLSCWDLSPEHGPLGPGNTHIPGCVSLWGPSMVLCAVWTLNIWNLFSGGSWRKAECLWLWSFRKHETLQPGETLIWPRQSPQVSVFWLWPSVMSSVHSPWVPRPGHEGSHRTVLRGTRYAGGPQRHSAPPHSGESRILRIRMNRVKWFIHQYWSKDLSVSLSLHVYPFGVSVCISVSVSQMSNLVFHQNIEHWDHLDFIWGLDAPTQMFPSILKLLQEYQ